MGPEENKAFARRIPEEVVNGGNFELLDELLDSNFVEHNPSPGLPATRDGTKMFLSGFRAAFPDVHVTIDDIIAEGDKVVERTTVQATMTGDYAGMPASGKSATWQQIHISRIENGKIVEHWTAGDQLGMLQQLGLIPSPDEAAGAQ